MTSVPNTNPPPFKAPKPDRTFSNPMQTDSTPFRAPWYLRSGHIQTILGPYAIRRKHVARTVRMKVPLLGDGHTFLYDSQPEEDRCNGMAIMLLHGLGGHHASPYLTRIASLLVSAGFRAIRVDLPGCGPSARLSDRAAHAGCSEDLRMILQWGHANLGIDRWRVAGFSLGGNVTLKLLAELAHERHGITDHGVQDQELTAHASTQSSFVQIERAVVVAPPVDLHHCCMLIEQGFNRVYNRFFLRTLKRYAAMRAKQWPRWKAIADKAPSRIGTIRQFDDIYTSAIAGFRDALDYYATCSTHNRLSCIDIPTSLLVDSHDPIVPASMFERVELSRAIQLTKTTHGGHLGYFKRNEFGKIDCWMDPWVVNELLR